MTCATCDDTGWKSVEKDGLRGVVVCDCVKQRKESERKELMSGELWRVFDGPGKAYAQANLKQFPEEYRVIANEVFDPNARGLLIGGSPGSGKTHFMAAICREALTRNKTAVWTTARALLRRIWDTYRDDSSEIESAVLKEFGNVQILAIDDLGHEGKISDAAIGAFHELLSQRHDNFLPTIITTNLTSSKLAQAYDEAITSRLSAWRILVMVGSDRRLI